MRFKVPALSFVFLILLVVPAAYASAPVQDVETTTQVPENAPINAPAQPVSPVKLNDEIPSEQNQLRNNEKVNLVSDTKVTLREQIQQKRMDALKNADAKRAELQQKLTGITDSQKSAIVQRLDTRFVNANNTATDRWVDALEVMSSMLDRAGSEAADLKDSGTNTFVLDSAITRARTALTNAETAVANQAQKTYALNITTEESLKMNVGATVSQFSLDLRNTYNTVVAAKQALKEVIASLATLKATDAVQVTPATNSAEVVE